MNWAWATSLDQIWRSPSFPMWLTLAAAGFFGIIVLITLLRAEKSVANGALTVITLLALGIAVAATLRGFGPAAGTASRRDKPALRRSAPRCRRCRASTISPAIRWWRPARRPLFGSAESTAAAVSYAASMITRLTSLGDAATAQRSMTPETAGAAPRGRTRPLRPDGACAADARPLHADPSVRPSLADRSPPDRRQYGRAGLSTAWSRAMRRHGTRRAATRRPRRWRCCRLRCRRADPPMPNFQARPSRPPVSIMTPGAGTGTKPPAASRSGASSCRRTSATTGCGARSTRHLPPKSSRGNQARNDPRRPRRHRFPQQRKRRRLPTIDPRRTCGG